MFHWWLKELSDQSCSKLIHLKEGVIIFGRSRKSDIQLEDSLVSRKHASLIFENDMLYISDLGSRNGVYVNENEIDHSTRLYQNDIIRIGHSKFELCRIEIKQPYDSMFWHQNSPTRYMKQDDFETHTITIPKPTWSSFSTFYEEKESINFKDFGFQNACVNFLSSVYSISETLFYLANENYSIDLNDFIKKIMDELVQQCNGESYTLRIFNSSDWVGDLVYQVNHSCSNHKMISLSQEKTNVMIAERLLYIVHTISHNDSSARNGKMSLMAAPLINSKNQVIGFIEMASTQEKFVPNPEYAHLVLLLGSCIDE